MNLRTVLSVTAHRFKTYSGEGTLISVVLCMSPCRSDYIISIVVT